MSLLKFMLFGLVLVSCGKDDDSGPDKTETEILKKDAIDLAAMLEERVAWQNEKIAEYKVSYGYLKQLSVGLDVGTLDDDVINYLDDSAERVSGDRLAYFSGPNIDEDHPDYAASEFCPTFYDFVIKTDGASILTEVTDNCEGESALESDENIELMLGDINARWEENCLKDPEAKVCVSPKHLNFVSVLY